MGVSMLAGTANTEVVTAITGISDNIIATVGDIAPAGIAVVGVYMAWKFGIKFFKGLSK